jgi:hypothetical protein
VAIAMNALQLRVKPSGRVAIPICAKGPAVRTEQLRLRVPAGKLHIVADSAIIAELLRQTQRKQFRGIAGSEGGRVGDVPIEKRFHRCREV